MMHGTIFLANASSDNQKNGNMIDDIDVYHEYIINTHIHSHLMLDSERSESQKLKNTYEWYVQHTKGKEHVPIPLSVDLLHIVNISHVSADTKKIRKIQEMRPYNIDQPGVSDLLHQSDTNDLPIPGPQLKQPKLYQSPQVDLPNACPCPCPSESSGGINLFLRCMKNFNAK